jgi:hypothetical protein
MLWGLKLPEPNQKGAPGDLRGRTRSRKDIILSALKKHFIPFFSKKWE